ncbi:hypothetical protein BDV26DRAFT_273111 [Aspergillus bertholletiae]|uniref:Transmembrane protein n=1 Tax=Aspergillus bertholletiae TaxID=1226010 RepID=A0A5N7ASX0_9EURO|nr:hypothetical protein BDV26DRAFT_273111 [Aspergillus bertholletiae]
MDLDLVWFHRMGGEKKEYMKNMKKECVRRMDGRERNHSDLFCMHWGFFLFIFIYFY